MNQGYRIFEREHSNVVESEFECSPLSSRAIIVILHGL